ncbi:CPCC family cysteine-rich protein [Paenibacillus sp. Soil787]|uniref:CPCC family cysteine-rich protein n=1 Tax=Paenibacillus sp. Soil787 TaxID=1736411 RepID=UPI001F29DB12|nr:CPCC family cysteine-rich protein [Paenibacillus sp. Soil787]
MLIFSYNESDYEGGANKVSLRQGQLNFKDFGACEERCKQFVRVVTNKDIRDPNWKPLS